jgi:hypothetical protein
MRATSIAIMLAAGCVEYTPVGQSIDPGVNNPREIQTPERTDVLVQAPVKEVDILWLIDNSSSMGEEQEGIADNLGVFLEYFLGSGLDYHIGVISTDMDDPWHRGRLQEKRGVKWIDMNTPDAFGVMGEMTRLGIEGSGNEKGRDPIYRAIEILGDTENAGFYRGPSAGLHIVAISDEEDSSVEISEPEFIEWLKSLKLSRDNLSFSSIVSPYPVCPGANDPGVEYIRYTEAIGGTYWPICDDDWGAVLEILGLQASGMAREFFLSALPVPGTIQVRVTDETGTVFEFLEGDDWGYSAPRNSITFIAYVPDPWSEVEVVYESLAAKEID